MESYHGMLACVIAGAGTALIRAACWKYARPSAGFRGRWPKSGAGSPPAGVAPGAKPASWRRYSAAERRSANSGFSINTLSGSG